MKSLENGNMKHSTKRIVMTKPGAGMSYLDLSENMDSFLICKSHTLASPCRKQEVELLKELLRKQQDRKLSSVANVISLSAYIG